MRDTPATPPRATASCQQMTAWRHPLRQTASAWHSRLGDAITLGRTRAQTEHRGEDMRERQRASESAPHEPRRAHAAARGLRWDTAVGLGRATLTPTTMAGNACNTCTPATERGRA